MFYVEHMKKMIFVQFFLFLTATGLVSCNKRDPNPELSDTIYLDLKSELEIAQKNLAAEEAQHLRVAEELKAVVPQTGQNKFAVKRLFESDNNLDRYKQQVKYFEIAVALRKNQAKSRYLENLTSGGRPWPDQAEIDDYRARLKLQKAKLSWEKKPDPNEKPLPAETKDVPRGTN